MKSDDGKTSSKPITRIQLIGRADVSHAVGSSVDLKLINCDNQHLKSISSFVSFEQTNQQLLEKYTMKVSKVTMALISLLSTRAGAFSSVARRSAVCSTTARFMSGAMPFDDDKMPFYALGTNLALQVGGQGNFKTLLDDKELEIVLEGAFCLIS